MREITERRWKVERSREEAFRDAVSGQRQRLLTLWRGLLAAEGVAQEWVLGQWRRTELAATTTAFIDWLDELSQALLTELLYPSECPPLPRPVLEELFVGPRRELVRDLRRLRVAYADVERLHRDDFGTLTKLYQPHQTA